MPLVINTPGWIKGTGMDLLQAMCTAYEPDHVLQISDQRPTSRFDHRLSCVYTFFDSKKKNKIKIKNNFIATSARVAVHDIVTLIDINGAKYVDLLVGTN